MNDRLRITAALAAVASHMRGGPTLTIPNATARALRKSDWQHDPERVAAARAKRERRRARASGSSS